jgi:hypothetical protein
VTERLEGGGGCWCRCGRADCGTTLRGEVSRLREALDRMQQQWANNAPAVEYKRKWEAAESRLAQVTKALRSARNWIFNSYCDDAETLEVVALCDNALLTPPAASDGPSTLMLHLDERFEGEKAQAIAAIRRSEKLTGADMSRRVGADGELVRRAFQREEPTAAPSQDSEKRCVLCRWTEAETHELLVDGLLHRSCASHIARGGRVRAGEPPDEKREE